MLLIKDRIRLSVVKLGELCPYLAAPQLVVMYLRNRLQCQVNTSNVINVNDFKHVYGNLINWVKLVSEKCSLLHLFLADFSLENNIGQPMAFFESHYWKIFELTVVEFAKKRFFDRVDVLDVHLLRSLFNVKLVE